jgi:catechol 2,3-dioxygenase-like lactoylglutathione lyase family enzyme
MTRGPVFNQFNIVVSDMDASIAFYRRLGLTIEDTDPQWGQHHRNVTQPDGIDLDLDSIAFARQWNRGWPEAAGGRTGVLSFRVDTRDTVDTIYDDLVGAGYTGQQPPYDAFWGARFAIVEDPDGNAIGLMSPIDPARRSADVTPP